MSSAAHMHQAPHLKIQSLAFFHITRPVLNKNWLEDYLWTIISTLYQHFTFFLSHIPTHTYEHNSQDTILVSYPSSGLVSAIGPPSTKVPILLFERSRFSWLWVPAKTKRRADKHGATFSITLHVLPIWKSESCIVLRRIEEEKQKNLTEKGTTYCPICCHLHVFTLLDVFTT